MLRLIYLGVGAVLTLAGLALSISPIPFGFLIVIPGLTLLAMGSPKIAEWLRRRRLPGGERAPSAQDGSESDRPG